MKEVNIDDYNRDLPFAYPQNSMREWAAKWIGLNAEPASNSWILFRKELQIDSISIGATAHIAADSKYWLWVNDDCVVFEGAVKRGPTPVDTYYDTVDISQYLKEGRNQISVQLWYWGQSGFCHKDSGQSGLIVEIENGTETICSDETWNARLHPAYGFTEEPHPNRRLPEANIRFDARKDIPNWYMSDFDDSHWHNAIELESDIFGNLIHRQIPMWKDVGIFDYINRDEIPAVSDGSKIKCKLPYNAQFTPILEIEAQAGELIEIRMDNYQGGSENNVRAEYITKQGKQRYESIGWMNGHEMHYTIPLGVKIRRLAYRETGYDTEFSSGFQSDNPVINALHEKAVRTLYVTMRDTYMDCPDRERSQWWGDVVNELGEAFYVLDTKSHALARKGIYELVNWQRSNNVVFSPVPSNGCCGELPLQMLASVGRQGFWTYYFFSGEEDVIHDVYDRVAAYLSLWTLGRDGLIRERKGDWTFIDWGSNKDSSALYNAWAYIAFDGQRLMAELLGKDDDVKLATDKMLSIKERFNKTFWQGDRYRSKDYEGDTDDRANAMAVIAGLAESEYYPAIRNVLNTEYHASPYMEKYVLESLYMMRYPDDAVKRMEKRYKKMLDSDYTTLWEGWGIGAEGFGGGTINHAWSGGPVTLLAQYALGIEPTIPGFKTFHVMPQMGNFNQLSTTVCTVSGEIHVALKKDDNTFRIELSVPEGTEAVLGIPSDYATQITLNNNSAEATTVTDDYHCLDLASGQWIVTGMRN